MKPDEFNSFEQDLGRLARRFSYPPTPDVASAVRARLDPARRTPAISWKPVAVVALVVLLVLFSVPAVRAKLAEMFQVGVVHIFPASATTTPDATALPTDVPESLLNLAGRTTLTEARQRASFPLLLPAYPPDLGQPDIVYYQGDAQMAILVWLEPSDPHKVRMSLHELGPGSFIIKKMNVQVVEETTVNGGYALWTTGPYMAEVRGNDYDMLRLVDGHTLIWEAHGVTYRLETGLSLAEAIRIAESLR